MLMVINLGHIHYEDAVEDLDWRLDIHLVRAGTFQLNFMWECGLEQWVGSHLGIVFGVECAKYGW